MTTDEEKLQQLATDYVTNKAQFDKLKKHIESTNLAIKQCMELMGKDECEAEDGTIIIYGIQKRESFNEEKLVTDEKLIKLLKHFAPNSDCIKTREYVDMDALENEIYKGQLSDDAMCALESCKNVKEVVTLTLKKAKKGKK